MLLSKLNIGVINSSGKESTVWQDTCKIILRKVFLQSLSHLVLGSEAPLPKIMDLREELNGRSRGSRPLLIEIRLPQAVIAILAGISNVTSYFILFGKVAFIFLCELYSACAFHPVS